YRHHPENGFVLASTTEAKGHAGSSEFHNKEASVWEQAEGIKGQTGAWRAATASSENDFVAPTPD
ncbi:2168_t:CDS:2, partial [Paraglomus occultum]